MSSLRIAYLCLQATTEGQASYAHVHEIIEGLEALGHSVDLYQPRYAGSDSPGAIGRFFEFASIRRRLIRRLGEYDALYIRGHPLAWPAARFAKRAGVPTIQECNGPYEDFVQAWPSARPFAGLLAAMARSQFSFADAVIAVTPQLAAWLSHDLGRSVDVVPNGANVDLFTPDQPLPDNLPEHYAVFFGALQPWQGVETILEATRQPEWPESLSVVVIGDGRLEDEVRAAAVARPDRVLYMGRLPYREVPSVVANSVVSLAGFSTEYRTASGVSPLKLYESMACGVPVIAGNLPGQAEVVRDAQCGLLVDPITPENLARAAAEIVRDPEAARAMGRRGRDAAVMHHSWTARAKQTAAVIEAVTAASTRTAPVRVATGRHIAYLSLQAVVEGQDTWAAVTEIIKGLKAEEWVVDEYFPHYKNDIAPGLLGRFIVMCRIQMHLSRRIERYDAIYVRSHPAAWPIAKFARRKGIAVVQECNGPYEDLFIAWPSTRIGRPIFEGMQRGQYRDATAVISVAQGLTDWLKTDTGNEHIITNGNGANIEAFRPDVPRRAGLPDKFAVFFGQFPAWQGIPALLRAVQSALWPEDLKLVFVGDGALRHEIENVVLAMPERVFYLGKLPYEEVAQVVAHAELSYVPMVAPEREAKFSPLKLYESMACGVPVVASDTIGISEVVTEDRCGILVTPGDADGIARATWELLADPVMASEMGARGRKAAVEKYSWSVRACQRREIIEDAIRRTVTTEVA